MWFRFMMLAFVFNGICNFGIRILAGYGLAGQYTTTYFLFWFLGGSLVLGAVLLYRGKPNARIWGSAAAHAARTSCIKALKIRSVMGVSSSASDEGRAFQASSEMNQRSRGIPFFAMT